MLYIMEISLMQLEKDDISKDVIRWLKPFLQYITGQNYSINTINSYKQQIMVFSDFCEEISQEVSLQTIKPMHISYFFAWLDEKISAKNNTKASYLRTLKSFFNFITRNNNELVDFDYLFKNLKLKLKKGEKKEVNYLNSLQTTRILEFLDKNIQKKADYMSNRNSLLIKLLFGAGLRISEALNLKLCDFFTNSDNDEFFELNILAKGGEIQSAYILKDFIKNEMDYIKKVINIDEYVFLTVHNTRLNRITAYTILKNIYIKSGVFNKTGCHILRHSFAMDLMSKDINLGVIQKALRHKKINTTMIYAEGSPEMIKAALKNTKKFDEVAK